MEHDYSKLRGRIIEKFGTIGNFADKLGVTIQAVSAKLRGEVSITPANIIKWSELLDIDKSEIGVYFFTLKV